MIFTEEEWKERLIVENGKITGCFTNCLESGARVKTKCSRCSYGQRCEKREEPWEELSMLKD